MYVTEVKKNNEEYNLKATKIDFKKDKVDLELLPMLQVKCIYQKRMIKRKKLFKIKKDIQLMLMDILWE